MRGPIISLDKTLRASQRKLFESKEKILKQAIEHVAPNWTPEDLAKNAHAVNKVGDARIEYFYKGELVAIIEDNDQHLVGDGWTQIV